MLASAARMRKLIILEDWLSVDLEFLRFGHLIASGSVKRTNFTHLVLSAIFDFQFRSALEAPCKLTTLTCP